MFSKMGLSMIPKGMKQHMSKLLWGWLGKLRPKKSREKTPRDSDRFKHDWDGTRYRMAHREKTGWSPKSPGTSKASTPSRVPPTPNPVYSESRPHHDLPVSSPAKPKTPEPAHPNPGISERYVPPVPSLSIPSEADLLYPTVCALRGLGGSSRKSELVRKVIETEGYSSNEELDALKRRLGWVLTALKGISVVENTSRGYWSLTKKGLTIDEVKIRSDHADYRKRIT